METNALQIESLKGLTLWPPHFAADTLTLSFGQRRMIAARNGRTKEVGQFALHVQCHYEFTSGDGDRGGAEVMPFPLTVSSIRETPVGILLIEFGNGGALQVLPDLSPSSDPEEQWRFFRPYTGDKHMVFLSSGRYL